MNLAEPDLGLETNLCRLGLMMRDWPGHALTSEGAVRLLHETGTAAPVFWCFNAKAEFTLLARELGEDRPLAGMRSLSQILRVTPDTAPLLDAVASHYAGALIRRFGRAPCIVGGNCQAASIAWRVAMRLWVAGVPVLRLITLDAELHLPFPGHMRLLFGAQSPLYNPFLRQPEDPAEDPARPIPWHWQRAWQSCDWGIVPGGHGAYFSPEPLAVLAKAINADSPPPRVSPPLGHLKWHQTGTTQTGIWVEAMAPPELAGLPDLALMPLWQGRAGGVIRHQGPDWVVPVDANGALRCHLPRPPQAEGPARVALVLCAKGLGPLGWPGKENPGFDFIDLPGGA